MPTCWIIAGPNGAGKTTFALDFLPLIGCRHFINADAIAVGLNPIAPEAESFKASRIYLKEIKNAIATGKDFGFETTLSGRSYLSLIEKLKKDDWRIELVYLALPSVEMSLRRVKERVLAGGHNIPTEAIERRFSKSLRNLLNDFSPLVNRTRCFYNEDRLLRLIFSETKEGRIIENKAFYENIIKLSKL